jgi:hypothetical protein
LYRNNFFTIRDNFLQMGLAMSNIVYFEPSDAPAAIETPLRRRIRRNSRFLSALFGALFALTLIFGAALAGAVVFYDGPWLAAGPGGVWVGRAPDASAGLLPLRAFTFAQRLVGAFALTLLAAPAAFVFFHLRGLFRLYAMGAVFSAANARRIKHVGIGLLAYALAPFLANRLVWLAGVRIDPVWFHLDELQAAALGALLFVIADVMQFGREIEQERDGFV